MADYADDNLLGLVIRNIEYAIISNSNTKTIPVPELFAAVGKWCFFESQNRFGDARLHLRRQNGKLLPRPT